LQISVLHLTHINISSDFRILKEMQSVALKVMRDLREKCHRYNGNFSLLWHNSHLKRAEDKKFFMEMLK